MSAEPKEQTPPAADTADASEQSPETPAQQTESSSTAEDYGEFTPGTIVLAKLKSFPPWPAIVVPFELIPEDIKKVKRKVVPQPTRSAKKRGAASAASAASATPTKQDNRSWCVRFLRDDTYMWGGVNDISILTKEQIEKFLNDKKGKKLIKSAYEMALNPPDVEEFIIWGSDGKPITIDNEADDVDFTMEDAEGADEEEEENDDDDSGSIEDELEEDDSEELKPNTKRAKFGRPRGRPPSKKAKQIPTKKKATSSDNGTPRGKPGRKPGRKKNTPIPDPEPETSSDEDWDNDDEETEPAVAIDIPSSKSLNDELKKRTPLIKRARITLQDFFLETKDIDTDPKSIKQINSTLDSLEKYPEIQPSLVKHYNLHKVMFDILKRPDLANSNKDIKKFRRRIESLVDVWFDVKIETDENWDFEEKEEEVKEEVNETSEKEETNDTKSEENCNSETPKETGNGVKEELDSK